MEVYFMMRKAAIKATERELKARGVYKPYVSEDNGFTYIESYPLQASIFQCFSTEEGLHSSITIYDYSLPRIGQDAKVDHTFTKCGQDVLQRVAELLKEWHPAAYARAKAQDVAAGAA
jgi:hypothetical protein